MFTSEQKSERADERNGARELGELCGAMRANERAMRVHSLVSYTSISFDCGSLVAHCPLVSFSFPYLPRSKGLSNDKSAIIQTVKRKDEWEKLSVDSYIHGEIVGISFFRCFASIYTVPIYIALSTSRVTMRGAT